VDIHYAMGAALTSVIATSSGAAAALLRDGLTNMSLGMFLCIATTVGAVTGALINGLLDAAVLSIIFGLILFSSGLFSMRERKEKQGLPQKEDRLALRLRLNGSYPQQDHLQPYKVYHTVIGFCLMFVAGIVSGLLGVGSGAFKVLAMDRAMKLPFRVTTATSNFMIGVTAAASVGIYLKKGYVDPVLAAPVALGVLIGALFGVKLLPTVPLKLLKRVFCLALFVVAVEMVSEGFRKF
jgi:uncharacterized membrane protein YfcA